MSSDAELLREFAQQRSEAAFGELVRRHLNLVYAVALRRAFGNRTLAEEATQTVFADLARKAGELSHHEALSGWLYKSARYAAAQTLRGELRRKAREEKVIAMDSPASSSTEDPDWDRLRGELDAVLDTLGEADRQAVVLRFYAAKPFGEIGAALRLSEDAARRRVDRALEKLRIHLARRGITSTVAALSAALASNAATVAPAGLGSVICGAVAAGTATGVGGIAAVGLFSIMNTAKLTAVATTIAAAAMVGVSLHHARTAREATDALASARLEIETLHAKASSLEEGVIRERERADAAELDNGRLLAAIQTTAAATPPSAPAAAPALTTSAVQARFARAQDLARRGENAAALEEFLWCYDEGMVSVQSMGAVRNSFLVGALGRLAATYPPAGEALRARRDAAERTMRSDPSDSRSAMDFAALNDALDENLRTLEFIRTLPATDLRRESMGRRVVRELVKQRRYAEAINFVDYGNLLRSFELGKSGTIVGGSVTEERANMRKKSLVRTTSQNIELLAGAGDTERARDLLERVMAVDRSEETLTTLRQHLERAGQSQLLDTLK